MDAQYDITHLAHLARLRLTDEERARYEKEFGSIIAYVGQLQSLALDEHQAVQATVNVFRDDVVYASSSHAALIAAFPERSDDALSVPQVISYE